MHRVASYAHVRAKRSQRRTTKGLSLIQSKVAEMVYYLTIITETVSSAEASIIAEITIAEVALTDALGDVGDVVNDNDAALKALNVSIEAARFQHQLHEILLSTFLDAFPRLKRLANRSRHSQLHWSRISERHFRSTVEIIASVAG